MSEMMKIKLMNKITFSIKVIEVFIHAGFNKFNLELDSPRLNQSLKKYNFGCY